MPEQIARKSALPVIRQLRKISRTVVAHRIGIKPRDYVAWESGCDTIDWTPERWAVIASLIGDTADAPDTPPEHNKRYYTDILTLCRTGDGWRMVWTLKDFATPWRMSSRAFVEEPAGYWRHVHKRMVATIIRNPDAMRDLPPLVSEYTADGYPIVRGKIYRAEGCKFDLLRIRPCPACGREHGHGAPAPGDIERRCAPCHGLFGPTEYCIARAT